MIDILKIQAFWSVQFIAGILLGDHEGEFLWVFRCHLGSAYVTTEVALPFRKQCREVGVAPSKQRSSAKRELSSLLLFFTREKNDQTHNHLFPTCRIFPKCVLSSGWTRVARKVFLWVPWELELGGSHIHQSITRSCCLLIHAKLRIS